ncbi:hypothetical protein [Streptomyces abyssalis]|uniref:hypothetical protein n=1 Tax=Streptomyces abyssalis TaxID=933944 RepID=UPI00085BBAB6|nr:hypothetical protein [Streptomyces abyssalis]
MEFVIGVLALLFVLFVAFGVIAAVRVTRAVQRGVERTGSQVRRTVEETTLKARGAQPGPVGELARQRLELRTSIDGTRRALESDISRDPSLQEALGLLDRLHEHARQLDGEMRLLMDREPDKARTAELMPEVRERVARIKDSADSLRFAAQDRASRYDAEGLDALRRQIEVESGALRHWHPDGQALGHEDEGAPEPGLGRDRGGDREQIEGPDGREPERGRDGDQDRARGLGLGRGDVPPGFEKGRPQSAS